MWDVKSICLEFMFLGKTEVKVSQINKSHFLKQPRFLFDLPKEFFAAMPLILQNFSLFHEKRNIVFKPFLKKVNQLFLTFIFI